VQPAERVQHDEIVVRIRVGLNSGQIRAGVVGIDSPRYKLFGDTVNTASRMESTCEPGKVQVSPTTRARLTESLFVLLDRGLIQVKGKGKMNTFFVTGYREASDQGPRRIMIERSEAIPESKDCLGGTQSEQMQPSQLMSGAIPPPRKANSTPASKEDSYAQDAERPHEDVSGYKDVNVSLNTTVNFVTAALGREALSMTQGKVGQQNPDSANQEKSAMKVCWERLGLLFLLVPQAQKEPSWLAELENDRLMYNAFNLNRQIAFARHLTISMLLVLSVLSGADFFLDTDVEDDVTRIRAVMLLRAFGINVVGLAYLLSLQSSSLNRRFAQHLTILMLMVEGASLMLWAVYLYSSEPMIIALVAMYGAYALFYTVCTIAQRLALCAFTILGYVVTRIIICTIDGINGAAQNIAFLIIYVICMTCGVYLQEHLAHVSHYEQRGAEKKLLCIKQARTAGAQLLNNLLPPHVISLVREGYSPIAEHHSDVTIIFTDIKGFTAYSSRISPLKLVSVLNSMYSAFDEVISNWALHKVEIIGDAYFVSAGCPAKSGSKDRADPTEYAMRAVEVALALLRTLPSVCDDSSVQMRVGLHTGSVVAGVVGKKGPRYHLFGAAVGYAEQMESTGIPGRVQISDTTHQMLEHGGHAYDFEERQIEVEGEEEMQRTWLVNKSNSKEALAIQKRLMAQRRHRQSDAYSLNESRRED